VYTIRERDKSDLSSFASRLPSLQSASDPFTLSVQRKAVSKAKTYKESERYTLNSLSRCALTRIFRFLLALFEMRTMALELASTFTGSLRVQHALIVPHKKSGGDCAVGPSQMQKIREITRTFAGGKVKDGPE
jgi:hypothetical protein